MDKETNTETNNTSDKILLPEEIEEIPLSDLLPPVNSLMEEYDEYHINGIVTSISSFEFNNPILIDKDNRIVCGYVVYLACLKMNYDPVPCIRLSHLTPEQARAYRIADTKIARNSEWDTELMSIDVDFLSKSGTDIADLGLDGLDINLNFDNDISETEEKDKEQDNQKKQIIKQQDKQQKQQDKQQKQQASIKDESTNEVEINAKTDKSKETNTQVYGTNDKEASHSRNRQVQEMPKEIEEENETNNKEQIEINNTAQETQGNLNEELSSAKSGSSQQKEKKVQEEEMQEEEKIEKIVCPRCRHNWEE